MARQYEVLFKCSGNISFFFLYVSTGTKLVPQLSVLTGTSTVINRDFYSELAIFACVYHVASTKIDTLESREYFRYE